MFECPSCNKESITFWQKFWADRLRLQKCPNCSAEFFVSASDRMKFYYPMLLPALVIWLAAYFFESGLPLFAFIPLVIFGIWSNTKSNRLIVKS